MHQRRTKPNDEDDGGKSDSVRPALISQSLFRDSKGSALWGIAFPWRLHTPPDLSTLCVLFTSTPAYYKLNPHPAISQAASG